MAGKWLREVVKKWPESGQKVAKKWLKSGQIFGYFGYKEFYINFFIIL
jgi:hypothetical protein